jgi:hypothetical protein
MTTQFTRTKVLITVMTYPHPSRGYQECNEEYCGGFLGKLQVLYRRNGQS